MGTSCAIGLRWVPRSSIGDKSTLVRVMACCRQATSHYLSQCWSRSMSTYIYIYIYMYGYHRSQCVNPCRAEFICIQKYLNTEVAQVDEIRPRGRQWTTDPAQYMHNNISVSATVGFFLFALNPHELYTHSTMYPMNYTYGFVVFCFVLIYDIFLADSHGIFTPILRNCFTNVGIIVPSASEVTLQIWTKSVRTQSIITKHAEKTKAVCKLVEIKLCVWHPI